MPELPSNIEYLIEVFYDLWSSDGVTWSEIFYYQNIFEIELDMGELFILRKAFSVCNKWVREKTRPKKAKTKPKPHRRSRP
jgi:hypothetical protein